MNKIQAPRVRPAYATALFVLLGLTWFSAPASAQGSLIVDITSPGPGSTVSNTVPVNASVTIVGLITVRGVQFKLDGANLGAEDTSAPYSVSWDTRTASNGSHTLIAVARDALGVLWNSSPVTVTVFNDTTPPTVAVTSPSSGTFARGTIPVNATASDNVGVVGVQFRLDGANLGAEDTASPHSVSWNTTTATNGSHTLTAVARDAAGNTTTSGAVTITVDNAAPTVAITAPSAGSTVAGTATVSAAASDNVAVVGVQFRLDGANLGAEDTASPYSVSWNTTTAANGSHTLTAVARDAAGNTTTTAAVTVTVDNDTTPPTVAVTSPSPGASVTGTIPINADAADNVAVVGVQFRLDGANLGAEDTASPYSVSWNTTTAANGSHTLTAVARDAAGNTTTSGAVTVTVDNDTTPPTVAVTSPSPGASVTGTIPINADASDNVGVVGVQFRLDGANLGAEDTASPYSVSWNTTTAGNGSHTLTAVARDAAGNTTTSGAVTFTVDNDTTPPTVTVTSPSPGASVTGTIPINADAADNVAVVGVQFRLDGANLGAEDTASPYSVSWNTMTATNGSHTLTAVARDAAGNTTTSGAVTVTVDNDTSPPTVSINQAAGQADPANTSPINFTAVFSEPVTGFTAAGVTLTGTAGGNKTVTVTGGPAAYTVAVSGMTDGTVIATIAAGVVQDAEGNPNTTSTSTDNTVTFNTATPPTTLTRFESTDLAITFAPGEGNFDWFHGSRSRAWSAGTASFNRAAGARATYSFTGTSVTWISFRSFWAGIARVSVDGGPSTDVDLYVGAGLDPAAQPCPQNRQPPEPFQPGCVDEAPQARAFTATGLAAGVPHTLSIEVTGGRNPAARDNAVVVDAFDVGPPVPPATEGQRFEETSPSPAMAYTGDWTQGDAGRPWSGQTAATSTAVGDRATFSFTGTSVSWIGLRGPQTGIARVYLDGAFHAQVDTYAPAEVQAHVFTATDLAPAGHTLTIEVAGKRPIATSNLIVVDAFDVGSRFEEREASVVYTGDWFAPNAWRPWDSNKAWSGTRANVGPGTAALALRGVAEAEFTFTGTSVKWISRRGPWEGVADVFLDGVLAERVNLSSPTEQLRAPVFDSGPLAAGPPHVLKIAVPAQDLYVAVDAFDVSMPSPGLPVRRFQETDPSLSPNYTPLGGDASSGWVHGSGFPFWSGERAMFSTMTGARATFTFTGTSVTWIGDRSQNTGIARVTVDGGAPGCEPSCTPVDVDTYVNVIGDTQQAIFTRGGLAPGVHTLTIEVTGQKNPASGSTSIAIDAIDVQDESSTP